jgi:hypothetical protein
MTMEDKVLDLSQSVYQLCSQYPELPAIMDELGFHDIVKPGMLATAGRFMTIPKGAALKKLDLEKILDTLKLKGYTVTGL